MVLQNSGAISLDDIHVEVGGTSGTECSINDSDIRDLASKTAGATSSFNEFYGLSNDQHIDATGGTTTTSGNFRFHTFNSSGTFAINQAAAGAANATVDYVIIAGGGGGGEKHSTGGNCPGGGGGAGGYLTGTFNGGTTQTHAVTVGGGGSGGAGSNKTGANGSNSSIGSIATASGGGGGGATNPGIANRDGHNGGSGGGAGGERLSLIHI